MSLETFVDRVAEGMERRRFLVRGGGASAAAIAGLMGLSRDAHAYAYHGCNLCYAPNSCPSSVVCVWCWNGRCHGSPAHYHRCCEGHSTYIPGCDGGCANWRCSFIDGKFSC